MVKSFLRSGSLDAVLPLGENGHPVYLSALQLRETLRLRKLQHIADCLAIPQPNDAGDRLDWYSPVSGKITSWAAASESERSHALSQLTACQQAVAEMCHKAQQSETHSQMLFGALLAKALQFPDQNFVYLVSGKPVLTFWGFVSLEKKSRQDVLDCLRTQEEKPLPLNGSKCAASTLPLATPAVPVLASALVVATTPQPVPAPTPESPVNMALAASESVRTITAPPEKNILIRYGWMLPATALIIAFGMQLDGYVFPLKSATPEVKKTESAVAETLQNTSPAAKTEAPAHEAPKQSTPPEYIVTLPVAAASVSPTPALAETVPYIVENAAVTPVLPPVAEVRPAAKDELVLPADQIKLGSTKFLNGSWRVMVGGKSPITGKPRSLRYQLKNGKGTAKITQGDGIICHVDAFAGLMKSGNLVINTHTKARCSDGSRYQMPDLVCSQGATGAAVCSGQYNASTVLPMTIKRESK